MYYIIKILKNSNKFKFVFKRHIRWHISLNKNIQPQGDLWQNKCKLCWVWKCCYDSLLEQFIDTLNSLHGHCPIWFNPLFLTPQAMSLTYSPISFFSSHTGLVAVSPTLQEHICPKFFESAVVSLWTTLFANTYMTHSLTSFRSFLKYYLHPLNISTNFVHLIPLPYFILLYR